MLIGLYLISARPRGQWLLAKLYQQCLAIIYQLWGDWAGTGVNTLTHGWGQGVSISPTGERIPVINQHTFVVVKATTRNTRCWEGKSWPRGKGTFMNGLVK